MPINITMPAPHSPSTVAVVAPHGDLTPTVRDLTSKGWNTIAVTLPSHTQPLAATDPTPHDTYAEVIAHGSARRTLARLHRHHTSAVVAGSAAGVELADTLAAHLEVAGGGDPATSSARCDRGEQAATLQAAGLAAPRSLRTTSLLTALRWARFCQLPSYVLAPADTSVAGPARLCRTQADLSLAWPALRRAARRQSTNGHLVLQEALTGCQYLVHTVTRGGQHQVEEIWAETRTDGVTDRLDAVPSSGMLARALRYAMPPILDALGVQDGAYRSRIAYAPGRGPTLLSARLDPSQTLLALAGTPVPAPPRAQLPTTQVALIAPHDGVIDPGHLRALTSLSTLNRILGPLHPGSAVARTVSRLTSPGTLILTGGSHAIAEDYRRIRRLEADGLYVRSAS